MAKHFKSKQFDGKFRWERLHALLPDVKEFATVLYVGARPQRQDHLKLFRIPECSVDIVEIWKPNVIKMRTMKDLAWIRNIEVGDITKYVPKENYDAVFWWHGPEHVQSEVMESTLKLIESYTNKIIILGNPWGKYLEHSSEKNPYEQHVSHYQPEFFEKFGYVVETHGKEGPGSNMIAIKRK